MSLVTAEPFSSRSRLSTRLVAGLGNKHSTLRATLERCGPAVAVSAGGEVDASNDSIWRALLGEAAAMVTAPGALVVDVDGLDFMGCCAYTTLAEEARRCHRRGVNLRVVSRQPIVARIIAAYEFDGSLAVYPSVEAALPTALEEAFGQRLR
jgi:anti-anti-sigma factor